jgi:coenzyme Q-binding protein COQ10
MRYEESRVIKHTPNNLFNLVSDVSKYPEFLPWCLGARIKNHKTKQF